MRRHERKRSLYAVCSLYSSAGTRPRFSSPIRLIPTAATRRRARRMDEENTQRTSWLHRGSLETGFVFQDFPAHRNEFPVPDHRESVPIAAETLGNLGPDCAWGVRYRQISLYFPYRTGICSRRRVRYRLVPPPSSLRRRRRRRRDPGRPPKTPRLRGVLGEGPGEAEPETVRYGLGMRRSWHLSLLPSSAVRGVAPGGRGRRSRLSRLSATCC